LIKPSGFQACRTKLVGDKIPSEIEFRDSLPKTMVGNHLRRMLREEKPV